jgi:hypothetical protein
MADVRKALPSASVPPEGYKLLSAFAHSKEMSVSEAMRYLFQTSPELRAFAEQHGLPFNFEMQGWGGYRERSADDEGQG